KIPPPTAGGNAAAAAGASASVSPAASATPAFAASPRERGESKGKSKAGEQFQTGPTASPAGAMTSPNASRAYPERGKKKGKFGEQVQPGATTSPIGAEGASPSTATQYGKPGKGRKGEQFGGTPPTGAASAVPENTIGPRKQKAFERQNLGPSPGSAGTPDETLNQPGGKHNKRPEQQPGMSPSGQEGVAPGAQ